MSKQHLPSVPPFPLSSLPHSPELTFPHRLMNCGFDKARFHRLSLPQGLIPRSSIFFFCVLPRFVPCFRQIHAVSLFSKKVRQHLTGLMYREMISAAALRHKKRFVCYPDTVHCKTLPYLGNGLSPELPFPCQLHTLPASEVSHPPTAARAPNGPHRHALRTHRGFSP